MSILLFQSKRMEKVYLPKHWWWHQVVIINNFSIHSSKTCNFVDVPQNLVDSEISSSLGLSLRNTLRTQVQSISSQFPPPVIEIGHLEINWHSWTHPVIDIHARNVVIHVVAGSTANHHAVQGVHGQFNLPSISLGNSTIAEVIQAIPPPPTKEGFYPRMGIVNFTNVNVNITVYALSMRVANSQYAVNELGDIIEQETKSHPSKISRLWSINIPDDVFIPLLYDTQGRLCSSLSCACHNYAFVT